MATNPPRPNYWVESHDEAWLVDGTGRTIQRRLSAAGRVQLLSDTDLAAVIEQIERRDRAETAELADRARRQRVAAEFDQAVRQAAATMERSEQFQQTVREVVAERKPAVGKPCPEHIALDQGENRCGAVVMVKYLCSRPAEHDGHHVATAGDSPGAEVLATGTP